MSRRLALLALGALLVVAASAVWYASNTDPSDVIGRVDPADLPVLADSVPGPTGAEGWLNSPPLEADDLTDKVVVYDFWTYSCVNCIRTLPYLRAWWDRYEDDGLVIVGVHSPEFEFERDPDNVREATADLDVTWPVALDSDHAIWDAFANRYWPAKYVTDRQGRLRYLHFGEGSYRETEDVIRSLLGVMDDAPRADSRARTTTRRFPPYARPRRRTWAPIAGSRRRRRVSSPASGRSRRRTSCPATRSRSRAVGA